MFCLFTRHLGRGRTARWQGWPESEVGQQVDKLTKRRCGRARRPHRDGRARWIELPGRQSTHSAAGLLQVHEKPIVAPLDVLNPEPLPVKGVQGVVDYRRCPDMGRMNR